MSWTEIESSTFAASATAPTTPPPGTGWLEIESSTYADASSTIVPVAHGGTGADLTATGGTGYILKQNSVGGAITVEAPPDMSLKNVPNPANGNGTTDDTALIQAKISAAYLTAGASNYARELVAPSGNYVCGTLTFSNSGTNHAPLIFRGAGPEATVFTLAAATNAPLFDIGGVAPSPRLTFAVFRDFSIRGNAANQTVAAALMRLRNVDRCVFQNIYITDSKGDGIYISNSSVMLRDCQLCLNAEYGLNVEDSTSVLIDGGYYNNNTLQGVRAKYTAGAGILNCQGDFGLVLRGLHLEQNVAGEVLLDTVDNVVMEGCEVNSAGGSWTNGVVHVTGTSHGCRIVGNLIHDRSAGVAADGGVATNPYNWLVLDSLTKDNVYDVPKYDTLATIGGTDTYAFANPHIVDSGDNYNISATLPVCDGVSHATHQNLLTYSEDLTNAAWVGTNVGDIPAALVTTYGNPYDPAGNSTQIVADATELGNVQQAVTGLTGVAGTMFTFSAHVYTAASSDIRMEIRDSSNVILAREFVRTDTKWRRAKVSYVCTGNTVELRCRLVRYGGPPSQAFYVWGAQFNTGHMTNYIKTVAAAVTSTSWRPSATGMGANALSPFANNAAAVAGGLGTGDFYYETGTNPARVAVVT